MTTPSQVGNLIQLVAALGLLLLIFSGPWRQFVLDAVRQFLFQLRDRVFLLAADGKISFEEPIYIEYRKTINQVIRNLHEYSIFDVIFFRGSELPRESIIERVQKIKDAEVRDVMMKSCLEMAAVVFASMVLRSLIFAALLFPIAIFAAITTILDGPSKLWRISVRARTVVARLGAAS
jgi:hypothetical protein